MTPSRLTLTAPSDLTLVTDYEISSAAERGEITSDEEVVLRTLRGCVPSRTSQVEGLRPSCFFHYTPRSGVKVVCDPDPSVKERYPQRPDYGIPAMGENLNPPKGLLGIAWPNGSFHVVLTAVGVTRLTLGCDGERRSQIWRMLELFTVPSDEAPRDPSQGEGLRYLMVDEQGLIHLYLNAAHAPVVWRAIERHCFSEHKGGHRSTVTLLNVEGDLHRWERSYDVLTGDVVWTPAVYTDRAQAVEALSEGWHGEVFGLAAAPAPTFRNATPLWLFGDTFGVLFNFTREYDSEQRTCSWLWKAIQQWAAGAAVPVAAVEGETAYEWARRGGYGRVITPYDLAAEISEADDLDYPNIRDCWRDLGYPIPAPEGHPDAPTPPEPPAPPAPTFLELGAEQVTRVDPDGRPVWYSNNAARYLARALRGEQWIKAWDLRAEQRPENLMTVLKSLALDVVPVAPVSGRDTVMVTVEGYEPQDAGLRLQMDDEGGIVLIDEDGDTILAEDIEDEAAALLAWALPQEGDEVAA